MPHAKGMPDLVHHGGLELQVTRGTGYVNLYMSLRPASHSVLCTVSGTRSQLSALNNDRSFVWMLARNTRTTLCGERGTQTTEFREQSLDYLVVVLGEVLGDLEVNGAPLGFVMVVLSHERKVQDDEQGDGYAEEDGHNDESTL